MIILDQEGKSCDRDSTNYYMKFVSYDKSNQKYIMKLGTNEPDHDKPKEFTVVLSIEELTILSDTGYFKDAYEYISNTVTNGQVALSYYIQELRANDGIHHYGDDICTLGFKDYIDILSTMQRLRSNETHGSLPNTVIYDDGEIRCLSGITWAYKDDIIKFGLNHTLIEHCYEHSGWIKSNLLDPEHTLVEMLRR